MYLHANFAGCISRFKNTVCVHCVLGKVECSLQNWLPPYIMKEKSAHLSMRMQHLINAL